MVVRDEVCNHGRVCHSGIPGRPHRGATARRPHAMLPHANDDWLGHLPDGKMPRPLKPRPGDTPTWARPDPRSQSRTLGRSGREEQASGSQPKHSADISEPKCAVGGPVRSLDFVHDHAARQRITTRGTRREDAREGCAERAHGAQPHRGWSLSNRGARARPTSDRAGRDTVSRPSEWACVRTRFWSRPASPSRTQTMNVP